ncbi:hypothetical protein H311_00648 [Anncaliia algerae PRA109]|nr:hypothetical protein H311_00648 [Anncaliia algerae PRA109]
MDNSPKTIARIISKLVSTMPATDFSSNKLGGPGLIVQIDETMLNYKCKSHRDRSSTNKTDSLCIVEVGDKIIRAFATTIPDKKESTLLSIICTQVANNSVIWTDEHRSYSNLRNYNFTHGTVCYKFEFVNNLNEVNTQAVESFNNCLKLVINNRKGILTNNREIFLKEFLFLFNNKGNLLEAVLNLIKVN